MKKAISIFKYLLEFCIPLLLSAAIDNLSNTNYWYASEYIFSMQILYFIILFIEWIRRFQTEEKAGKFDNYFWLLVIFPIFYFSMKLLVLFPYE